VRRMSRIALVGLCVLCVAIGAAATSEMEYQREFSSWVSQFGKSYESTTEFFNRFNIFKANLDYINQRNAENLGFTLGVNQFTDLTNDEFRALMTRTPWGAVVDLVEEPSPNPEPTNVDWRDKGAVQKVKIKVNVVHVGHSPQLVPLRVSTSLRTELCQTWLNNRWLIVTKPKVVVMVVWNLMQLSGLLEMVVNVPRRIIPTPLVMVPARKHASRLQTLSQLFVSAPRLSSKPTLSTNHAL